MLVEQPDLLFCFGFSQLFFLVPLVKLRHLDYLFHQVEPVLILLKRMVLDQLELSLGFRFQSLLNLEDHLPIILPIQLRLLESLRHPFLRVDLELLAFLLVAHLWLSLIHI